MGRPDRPAPPAGRQKPKQPKPAKTPPPGHTRPLPPKSNGLAKGHDKPPKDNTKAPKPVETETVGGGKPDKPGQAKK